MNPISAALHGGANRRVMQGGVNGLLVSASATDASSVPRDPLDFGRDAAAPPRRVGTLRRAYVRLRGPRAGRGVAGDPRVLAGGKPITLRNAGLRLQAAALAHAMPALRQIHDPAVQDRFEEACARVQALEALLTGANEFGLSLDRVLGELRARAGPADASDALDTAERLIGQLTQALTPDPASGKPPRSGLIDAELLLAMPAFSTEAPVTESTAALRAGLARLDRCLDKRPGYDLNRLMSALIHHACIVEYAGSAQTLDRAVEGLGAIVARLGDSVKSGRDGYALMSLIGIDASLDAAIADLRTHMVVALMASHVEPPDAAAPPRSPEALAADARKLADDAAAFVRMECDLARSKERLMRALDRAGIPHPVEMLQAIRMDAAMVRGLVNQIERSGHKARDVGLAIMGVFLQEQALARSDAGRRMHGWLHAETQPCRDRIQLAEAKLVTYRKLAAALPASGERAKSIAASIAAMDAAMARDYARLRELEPREHSLEDPGEVEGWVVEWLGLADMDMKHVVQLESQGLSSAAEAHAALRLIQGSLDRWLKGQGLTRMKKHGLFTLLRTQRQEQRAEAFGKALLARCRRADGTIGLLAPGDPKRVELVRAAVLHLVPVEQAARGRKGMPVLAAFRPTPEAVRAQLAQWGVAEAELDELDQLVPDVIGSDGVTMQKIAGWVREAQLPSDSPVQVPPAALSHEEQAGELQTRLGLLLPRKPDDASRVQLHEDDDTANRLIARDAIRWIVLGELAQGHPPADADAIGTQLQAMGLPADRSAIDAEIAAPVTPDVLAAWKQDADAREIRNELVDSLSDVRIATRVRMNQWQRLKLASGMFGDAYGMQGRAALGRMSGVDFGNPGDPGGSLENVFRRGGDARLGFDLRVPLLGLARVIGTSFGAAASADAVALRHQGVVLRCSTPAKQQALTRKLLQKETITFDDLADAEDIMLLSERQVSGEAAAGLYASLQPGVMRQDLGEGRSLGIGMGARAMVGAAGQWSRSVAQNNKGRIERTEWLHSERATLSAQTNLSLRADRDAQAGVSVPASEISVRQEIVVKRRLRLYERAGKVVDAERFDQSYAGGRSAVELMTRLGGPVFERSMALLAADPRPEIREVHESIVQLLADLRRNELASLAWQLDATAGFQAGNAALERAQAADRHRENHGGIREDREAAARARKEAHKVFHTRSLYNPARVAGVSVVEQTATKGYLMGLFETSEVVSAEALPVEIKLYAQELLNLAAQARRELRYASGG